MCRNKNIYKKFGFSVPRDSNRIVIEYHPTSVGSLKSMRRLSLSKVTKSVTVFLVEFWLSDLTSRLEDKDPTRTRRGERCDKRKKVNSSGLYVTHWHTVQESLHNPSPTTMSDISVWLDRTLDRSSESPSMKWGDSESKKLLIGVYSVTCVS